MGLERENGHGRSRSWTNSQFGSSGISAQIFAVEAMAPLAEGWDYGSWSAVYNALSFGIAAMGSLERDTSGPTGSWPITKV